jgi:hypothetical protein
MVRRGATPVLVFTMDALDRTFFVRTGTELTCVRAKK